MESLVTPESEMVRLTPNQLNRPIESTATPTEAASVGMRAIAVKALCTSSTGTCLPMGPCARGVSGQVERASCLLLLRLCRRTRGVCVRSRGMWAHGSVKLACDQARCVTESAEVAGLSGCANLKVRHRHRDVGAGACFAFSRPRETVGCSGIGLRLRPNELALKRHW